MEFIKNNIKVIILTGKAGSGKNTVANIFKNNLKSRKVMSSIFMGALNAFTLPIMAFVNYSVKMSASALDVPLLPKVVIISMTAIIDVVGGIYAIGSIAYIKKNIKDIKNLKEYYENAEDKDNISIPNDEYKLMLK